MGEFPPVDRSGRLGVFVDAAYAAELAELLTKAHSSSVHAGHAPIPTVLALLDGLDAAASWHRLRTRLGSASGTAAVVRGTDPAMLLTTGEAGNALGISPRAIRKRVARGSLPGIRRGRDLLIPAESLMKELTK